MTKNNSATKENINKLSVNLLSQTNQALSEKWYESWVFAAHASQIPEYGDYITLSIGSYPLIILRDKENEIRAFNNSCRHRGSTICQDNKGNSPNLVCPYHQWTYNLDGTLVYARDMMDEIDVSEFPLKQFNIVEYHGFIFVNLANIDEEITPSKLGVCKKIDSIKISKDPHQWKSIDLEIDRKRVDEKWENAQSFTNATAKCLLDAKSISIWEDEDHIAVIRRSAITETQTEFSITCLVKNDGVEGKDFSSTHIANKWGCNQKLDRDILDEQDLPATSVHENDIDYSNLFSEDRIWDSSKQDLICTMIVSDTHNVKTYTFQTKENNWFKYNPGQFITLSLPINGKVVPRTYTISSTPSRPFSLSITIKAQPGSIGTKWIFENIKVGHSVKAYGPNGNFSFFNKPVKKYLLLSAGSGITPMMSMTRWMFDYGNDLDVNFINCVQTPEDIIFLEELKNIDARSPEFRLAWVAEEAKYNTWTGLRGRFNKLILGLLVPDYIERDVYCCGPAPFMKAVRDALEVSGFNMDNYFEESFGSPGDVAATEDTFPDTEETVNVSFGGDKSYECNQTDTLLNVAKNADLSIQSACSLGVCGTCKVKVISGETHMVHSGGISQKDIDNGYVLACCTSPLTDTVVQIP